MDIPPVPPLRRAGVLLAALGLAGCSGTPFGETLSRSFSPGAPAPAPREDPSPPQPTPDKPAAEAPEPEVTTPRPLPMTKPSPRNPSPYRVTIRLPTADPSAPAEALTRALRGAGVPFEVETIERMVGSDAGASAGSSAPPSPAAGAEAGGPVTPDSPDPAPPSVRPAPAP